MEKTGIKSLKIKYNRVFGYYIDVTKTNLSMVPDYYIRKQTLVNSERFIIPELKEYEEKILGADEKSKEIELRIYEEIRILVLNHVAEIQKNSPCRRRAGCYDLFCKNSDCEQLLPSGNS